MSKFYDIIKSAKEEREVDAVYTKGINKYFGEVKFEHPYKCDTYFETKTANGRPLRLLVEYKYNEQLHTAAGRAKVLIQVIYYLKKFENDTRTIPNVILVGDINECFIIHPNDLIKYLDMDVDWSISPSTAYMNNPAMMIQLTQDENIHPFVYNINENFSFKNVADQITNQAENVKRYVHVTEHNIAKIFDWFRDNVVADKSISANDMVGAFFEMITDNDNCYVHPKKANTMVTSVGEIRINTSNYKSFVGHYSREYKPEEKHIFAAISDRLIEDTNRRRKGEFYTPTIFVDEAHKRIADQFGEDWREKYVVWDCCCGTKNLTRDYRFKELYCSTLENAELKISQQYNKEATAFQFDFLNDPIENVPQGLRDALENNKPIIFLMNPPYATSSGMGKTKGLNSTVSSIKTIMNKNKMGICSNNLYAQFLYRIILIKHRYNLTNCNLSFFSPALFLSGSGWKGFRSHFFSEFNYKSGILFQASNFANVKGNWGIGFTIWDTGKTINSDCKFDVIESLNNEIKYVASRKIYNIDNEYSLKLWIKHGLNVGKLIDKPTLSNGITVKMSKFASTKIDENSIGCYFNVANNIYEHNFVALFTSCDSSNSNGLSILPDNFNKVMPTFSARKLVELDWMNWQDEYMKPNTEHPAYKEFENDSVVYSLFHSSSNQSSLRQIDYKGKKWDIKNEFFWMSKEDMMNLANENNADETYEDARTADNRFVYNYLQNIKLSKEAQDVLDAATELVKKTFAMRPIFAESHPEYQIMNWDCGYYQLKALWKEFFKDDFKAFRDKVKVLEDKMRPMVYELGFLKK